MIVTLCVNMEDGDAASMVPVKEQNRQPAALDYEAGTGVLPYKKSKQLCAVYLILKIICPVLGSICITFLVILSRGLDGGEGAIERNSNGVR